MSMARTTPAQKPRGFSKSKVFWFSEHVFSLIKAYFKGYTFPTLRLQKGYRKVPFWSM